MIRVGMTRVGSREPFPGDILPPMPDYEALKRENDELILQDELEGCDVPRGLPSWLGLHTTTACNLKCLHFDCTGPADCIDELQALYLPVKSM